MYRPSNLKRTLGVGPHAPIVISPSTGEGIKKLMQIYPGLKSVVIQGIEFTPEDLAALAEIPAAPAATEEEQAAEYEAFTNGDVKEA